MQLEQKPLPAQDKHVKQRLSKTITSAQFLKMTFSTLEFTGPWMDFMGCPEDNFSMLLYGESGNGKTEGEVQFCKYIAQFGQVYFNSNEQGISLSLQTSWIRNNIIEMGANVRLVHKEPYDKMVCRLKRKKSAKIVFIDSLQHTKITYDMWIALRTMVPKKIFILISHSDGRLPQGAAAKAILYDVDVKVFVKDFVMYARSRFGGGKSYMIYEQGYKDAMKRKKGKK
jgi:hypothetical protein